MPDYCSWNHTFLVFQICSLLPTLISPLPSQNHWLSFMFFLCIDTLMYALMYNLSNTTLKSLFPPHELPWQVFPSHPSPFTMFPQSFILPQTPLLSNLFYMLADNLLKVYLSTFYLPVQNLLLPHHYVFDFNTWASAFYNNKLLKIKYLMLAHLRYCPGDIESQFILGADGDFFHFIITPNISSSFSDLSLETNTVQLCCTSLNI